MDLKGHCLFCLEQIVPYVSSSGSTSATEAREGLGLGLITFQSLCTYLKISLPKVEAMISCDCDCDKFLCLPCFEMVDKLAELCRQVEEVERRIREVIERHDIISDKGRREAFEEKVEGARAGRRRKRGKDDSVAFVELFQAMVKGGNGSAGTAETLQVGGGKRKRLEENRKSKKTSKKAEGFQFQESECEGGQNLKTETETEPMEVKVELFEEDSGNDFGEENLSVPEPNLFDFDEFFGDGSTSKDGGKLTTDIEIRTNQKKSQREEDEEWKPEVGSSSTAKRGINSKQVRSKSGISKVKQQRSKVKSTAKAKRQKTTSTSRTADMSALQPQLQCQDCHLTFPTAMKRWAHRRKAHPPKLSAIETLAKSIPTLRVTKPPGVRNRVRIYICAVCGFHVKEYSNKKLLNYMEHMLSHDETSPPEQPTLHSCPHPGCEQQFNLKINLELHKACVHEARHVSIRCDYCTENTVFGTGDQLKEHLKTCHLSDSDSTSQIHSCRHCPMSYLSFEKVLHHMIKHSKSKKLLCPECGSVSSSRGELHEHCFQFHPELKKSYSCELCSKSYLTLSPLRFHMMREHGFNPKTNSFPNPGTISEALLTCPHCKPDKEKQFKTELALQVHIKSAHQRQKKYKCDQCKDKSFVSQKLLQEHVQNFHEKIRHPCPHCPKSYTEAYQLGQHLKVHTGEGLLTCHICSKQFPRSGQLKIHLRTHETYGPEDRRVCEECGKEFANQHKLISHKGKVHPKKLWECGVCQLMLKTGDALKSHMRTHSRERPYGCPVCGKGFNRSDILRVHVKGVHGKEWAEVEEKVNASKLKVK